MPLLETRASASAQGYGLFGATASTGNFFLIQQLSPSAVSTVTFSSIPATYKSLQVRFNIVAASAGQIAKVQLNGDSGTNYATHYLTGSGSAASAGGSASNNYLQMFNAGVGTVITYPSVGIVDILDYANTNKNKTMKAFIGNNQNTSAGTAEITSAVWLSTAAVTSLSFLLQGANFTGTISLYGVS